MSRLAAGGSNELYELEADGSRLVLRRPPRTPSAPGAHDVVRETRVLRALDATDLPHPRLVAVCPDDKVAGAPFYVMSRVEGFTARAPLPALFGEKAALRELAEAALDALVRIAALDWRELGLGGFGRPEGFLARQTGRWLGQLERYRTRQLPHLEAIAGWLDANLPDAGPESLLHGDYQLVNLMFATQRPARVAAVLDWEMSTVGDARADLGWLLAGWEEQGEPSCRPYPQITGLAGMPRRRELAERYAEATGTPIEDLAWFEVLALFKLSCIMEGSYFRRLRGESDNELHDALEWSIPVMLERAAAFAGGELV